MPANTVSFVDAKTGHQTEVEVDVKDYMAAADHNLSLPQYYALKYPTTGDMTTMEQFMASSGIRINSDRSRGIQASTMREVLHGMDLSAGTIVRPQNGVDSNLAARTLFPAVMLQLVADKLISDKEDQLQPWEDAFAVRTSVNTDLVQQVRYNVDAPEASEAMPTAQLADPAVMVSITLNTKSHTIPSVGIALQISDQALQSTSIDTVSIMLAAQARGQRVRRIQADMSAIINGDTDTGVTATPFVNASTFDSTIPGTNRLTNKAWFKWLWANHDTMSITHILADVDGILDIDARVDRPTVFTDTSRDPNRLVGGYTVDNILAPSPKIIRVDTAVIGANRLVGFDSRSALHEITNVSATYSSIESFVTRRAQVMRFDYGMMVVKLYDQAFRGLTIAA